MSLNTGQLNDLQRDRRRGWILYLLYESDPKPLDLPSLIHLLDQRNFPMTSRGLAKDLQFLRGAGLLMIADKELSKAEATRLLNRYAEMGDEARDGLSISITVAGSDFQEGRRIIPGVMRIN